MGLRLSLVSSSSSSVLRCRVTRVSGGVHALIVTNAGAPWICRYGATARMQLSLFLSFSSNDRGEISSPRNITLVIRDTNGAGMRRPFVLAARSNSIHFFYYAYKIRIERYDRLFCSSWIHLEHNEGNSGIECSLWRCTWSD